MDHTIELGSIPTIKHLVENEVGVTFLPRFCRGGCPGGGAARGAGDRDGGACALGGVRSSQEQVDQPADGVLFGDCHCSGRIAPSGR